MIKPLEWNNNVGLRMELYGCNPGNGVTGFCFAAVVVCYLFCVKPRANGRNIVGCYMLRPFAHPVACCWMLLRVVAQSLKPVKLFSQQHPTFLLFRDRGSVAQQFWIRLHGSSNIVGATQVHYVCTAGPKLVRSCCSVCTPLPTRTQHLPTLLAQQYWELLRPFARSLIGDSYAHQLLKCRLKLFLFILAVYMTSPKIQP